MQKACGPLPQSRSDLAFPGGLAPPLDRSELTGYDIPIAGRCRWCVISWILELPGDATHDEMALGALWQEAR
jgi:hypothetical protein